MDRPLPEIEGVSHRFVEAGGVRIHYAEAGAGDPLVLIHGWPQHWYEWRYLIPSLSRRWRVICPDLRGFGWSEAPQEGYDSETLVADQVALLDALDLREPVKLIGHDWGGWIGYQTCLRHPERIERYMALNVWHPFVSARRLLPSAWRLWYQAVNAAPGLGEWHVSRLARYRNPIARWIGGGPRAWTPQDFEIFMGQFSEPARARASRLLYRGIRGERVRVLRGHYHRTRLLTPTLQLHGTADRVIRTSHLPGFEPYADDMRLELVEDAGHFVAEERPERVIEAAHRFFGR
jgi:pimeloyl-ACP methyl ester carboxylesterase